MANRIPKRPRNLSRLVLQWGIIGLAVYVLVRPFFDRHFAADVEAFCPFGGMQALASYLNLHSLACSMTTVQIALGLALLLGVVVLGKLFCAYLCPLGTATEWLGRFARKRKMQMSLTGVPDRILRVAKYALLFVTFYFTLQSSELFCRKYDPYFALMSGFNADVVLAYAVPALVLLLLGSLFVNQFWCKYLCPLGALTNLGIYALPVSALVLLWILLKVQFRIQLDWVWLLGAICLAGFVFEAFTLRTLAFPGMRIVRHDDVCTNCRKCDKKCPMAIPVSQLPEVKHIDCHLCTDCISHCPEKGALTLNHRLPDKLPIVAAVVLTAAALIFSSFYELPTINEQWSTVPAEYSGTLELSGLRSVKCFGSSRSFANHVQELPGVSGVATFVKHHRVLVNFDKRLTDAEKVKAGIFSPYRQLINYPGGEQGLQWVAFGVDRCFDTWDQDDLQLKLSQMPAVCAFETSFGEPMVAKVYYLPGSTRFEAIRELIIQKKTTIRQPEGITELVTDFEVKNQPDSSGTIDASAFCKDFFPETDVFFKSYSQFSSEQMSVYAIEMPQAADSRMLRWIPYLVSQVSNAEGIVRVRIQYEDKVPLLQLWFVNGKIGPKAISQLISAPELLVHYNNKPDSSVKNPFQFKFTD